MNDFLTRNDLAGHLLSGFLSPRRINLEMANTLSRPLPDTANSTVHLEPTIDKRDTESILTGK